MKTALHTISADELKKRISSGEPTVLVDVLSKEHFKERHIPGAINIPLEELKKRAPKELPHKHATIVVYCANKMCPASPTAANYLEWMGYTRVIDFEDGIRGWEEAGFPLEGSDVS